MHIIAQCSPSSTVQKPTESAYKPGLFTNKVIDVTEGSESFSKKGLAQR